MGFYLYKTNARAIVNVGADPLTGKSEYENRNFNNVRGDLTAKDMNDVISAVLGLQKHFLFNIEKIDTSELQAD